MGLKKYLPKRWWLRYPLYAGVTLVTLWGAEVGLTWYWRQIEVGVETTRITAPLTAEGYPDYAAALNAHLGAGVTKENNAAVLLLRLWSEKPRQAAQAQGILQALNIEAGFTPVRWEDFETYVKRTATAPADEEPRALLERLRTMPWRGAEYPQVAAWLEANREALELCAAAAQRARYFVPVAPSQTSASDAPLLNNLLVSFGEMTPWYYLNIMQKVHAMKCLGEGDEAGFERAVVTQLRLGSLLAQGESLLHQMLGCMLEVQGYMVLQAGMRSGTISAREAQRLTEVVRQMPPVPGSAAAGDLVERYLNLDMVVYHARYGSEQLWTKMEFMNLTGAAPEAEAWLPSKLWLPINYNALLRSLNHDFDQRVAAVKMPAYQARREALDRAEAETQTGDLYRVLLGSHYPFREWNLMWKIEHTEQSLVRPEAQRQLTLGMLTLARERADKGAYPEALPAGLMDPFSGQALVYRREGAGYVLYSVGPDGKDDGGVEKTESGAAKQNDDVVVRVER
jgi:hypothetical protein